MPVFEAHPELFDEDQTEDFEHHILETFILFEMQKGEKSFWHPYFEVLPKLTSFWRWDPADIRETDDPFITCELVKIRCFMERSWHEMSLAIKAHPDVFAPGFVTEELFYHVETSVGTRVFGYSIPCTSMIPMADMLNHSDIDVQYEVCNK